MKMLVRKNLVAFMLFFSWNYMNGQIMGYESPVSMPSMSVYDNSMSLMYIQGLRNSASEYNSYLVPIVSSIIDQSRDLIEEGKYKECIKLIDETFEKYTFYNYQKLLYSNLEYIKGVCYTWLDDYDSAINWWKRASNNGLPQAQAALKDAYNAFYENAKNAFYKKEYDRCIRSLDVARSTGLPYPSAYVLAGEAYESLENYDYAKQMYKIAKKLKSSEANSHLKLLNKKIKEQKRLNK